MSLVPAHTVTAFPIGCVINIILSILRQCRKPSFLSRSVNDEAIHAAPRRIAMDCFLFTRARGSNDAAVSTWAEAALGERDDQPKTGTLSHNRAHLTFMPQHFRSVTRNPKTETISSGRRVDLLKI